MSVHASLAQEKLVHSVERTLSAPSPSEPNGQKPVVSSNFLCRLRVGVMSLYCLVVC